MNRFISKLSLLFLVAVIAPLSVMAQAMPPLPLDPEVRTGKLDNGLTYYIRHNEYPKGQADFFIAQKVGSIQEEDSQRGLAHFLEHMCFNGTKNFPGNNLVSWLESVGVKFGANLNAYTSIDETVYNISSVPVARESVIDSCLLILHDWADDLILDPEEIDKERSVIHEEWRRSNVGQQRILEKLLPIIYPDSKYAYRMPIGTMDVVDNFAPQTLRDYYERWYRPDLQGIVVVGDIDVNDIEAKIKRIFSPIKKAVNPAERVYYPVADNTEPIIAIGNDPEQKMSIVGLMFKSDPTPREERGNIDYLLVDYVTDIINAMLNERLNDIASKPGAAIAGAEAEYGDFLLAKTKEAFTINGLPSGDNAIEAIQAIYREALRAKRGGFTASEYDRARAEYLSRLEKAYNNRATTSSTSLAQECVSHFLDNEPMPGIENTYAMMNMVANQIPVEAINMTMSQLIDDKGNLVVLALLPPTPDITTPTDEQVLDALKSVEAEEIEALAEEVKSEPLIEKLPTPGKVVNEKKLALYDAIEWTLSNGVKVVVKPTDFKENEVLFEAIAQGGTSTLPDADNANLRYLDVALAKHGLGTYSNSDLMKYLSGKQANVELSLDSYTRDLEGSTVTKDLPTLMELIYSMFTQFTISPDDFSSMQAMIGGQIKNQEATPEYQFTKQVTEWVFANSRKHTLDMATIQAANRERIIDIVTNQLTNAADFTFYFTGKFDLEQLRALVEQYIATLPAKAGKAKSVKLAGLGIAPGTQTHSVKQHMDTPTTYCAIVVTGNAKYSAKNQKLASMAGQILSARLIKKVREEMGAVYSISAHGTLSRINDNDFTLQTMFPMKPELKDEVVKVIADEIADIAKSVTTEEFNKVKEYMLKEATHNLTENSGWLNAMAGYGLRPVDTFLSATDTINALTPADVQAFMADILKQGNYRVFIMEAE